MKIIETLRKILLTITIVIFGVLVALVIAQVFMRYVVGQAFMWGDELMRMLMIWGVFLAGSLCFYYQRHLAVDNLLTALPPKARKVVHVIISLLIIGLACFYVYQGLALTENCSAQTMASLHISKAFCVVSLPVSAALWIIFEVADIYYTIADKPRTPLIESAEVRPDGKEA